MDKLRNENAGIKYLLLAVDCLSHYRRVEPLKSKYATTAEAFKQRIKYKQPKKLWVDAGTDFKGASKQFVRRELLKFIKHSAKRSLFLLKKNRLFKKNYLQLSGRKVDMFIHL